MNNNDSEVEVLKCFACDTVDVIRPVTWSCQCPSRVSTPISCWQCVGQIDFCRCGVELTADMCHDAPEVIKVRLSSQLESSDCLYCGEPMPSYAKQGHEALCGIQETPCAHECGAVVMRRLQSEHADSACPRVVVSCPLAGKGCSARVARDDVERHMNSAGVAHCMLAVDNIDEHLQRIDAQLRGLRVQNRQQSAYAVGAAPTIHPTTADLSAIANTFFESIATIRNGQLFGSLILLAFFFWLGCIGKLIMCAIVAVRVRNYGRRCLARNDFGRRLIRARAEVEAAKQQE
jgi:TRAF-type zinc finger